MIYIHAENLGLLDYLVNTNFAETSAKNYSWSIRLSTRDNSSDKDTTVVEMPNDMALSLLWWYMEKEASRELSTHLFDLLDHDEMKNKILKQLELSVAKLTVDRNRKGFAGVVLTTAAEMANECEDHIEYAHATKLFALLDAKGFEKEVDA